jgi:benzodiazapine receptor
MSRPLRNALFSTLAFIAMLTINALANILPINGLNTGEVSALYPSLFTPAGITFSIWSVIYLLLIGFIILQWRNSDAYIFAEVSQLFWLSCLLNLGWILSWHYLQVSMSVTLMLLLLLTLAQLFLKVRKISLTKPEQKIFIRLPFTIYFAWICVATIANISTLLVSNNWDGGFLSAPVWTIVMMIIASLLALYIMNKYRAPVFALVIVWALFGIFMRWNGSEQQVLSHASLSLLLIVSGGAFATWRKTKFALL